MDGLQRAQHDLHQGRPRKARDRLKGVLSSNPAHIEARRLLAEAYRQDRQWAEAGRWGYLVSTDASNREREAFERHVTCGWPRGLTRLRLKHLLRTTNLSAIANDYELARISWLRLSPTTASGWFPDGTPVRGPGRSTVLLRRLEMRYDAWRRGGTEAGVATTINAELMARLGALLERSRSHPDDPSQFRVLRFATLDVQPDKAGYVITYRFRDHDPVTVPGAITLVDLRACGTVEFLAQVVYTCLVESEAAIP